MNTLTNFRLSLLLVLSVTLSGCNGQVADSALHNAATDDRNVVGGAFENRDYMYQGMPERIAPVDTSPGWGQNGQKLFITGTVYRLDGKTPAPDVMLYYYHTNLAGRYVNKPGESRTMPPNQLGQTHGYIRGWVKTDQRGKYAIYTTRPGAYPSHDEPAHIHVSLKEPGLETPYYIDEFVFDDDELLTGSKRKKLENRGGSGILRVLVQDSLQLAEHNVILGLNIPNYPQTNPVRNLSGRQIGEDQPSFTPFHAFGPDKGTRACPVCKYGRYHGILYFVGNHPDWNAIKKWITFLEQQSLARKTYLKAYFVYGNAQQYDTHARQQKLEKLGTELNVNHVALTFVPSFDDPVSEANLNRIDPDVKNTFIVFRNRTIIDKFVDLAPTAQNFRLLATLLDQTKGDYVDLPEPSHK